MRVNCIFCGHNLELDDAYDSYRGMIKCYVCGSLLQIGTEEGKIRSVTLADLSGGFSEQGAENDQVPFF